MSIAEVRRTYTPDELLALPDAINYELVDGELLERHSSFLSCWVEGRVFRRIAAHCEATGVGIAFLASLGYQCFPSKPQRIRKPDVSFIAAQRFARDFFAEEYCPIAPDFAVEVISPNDLPHHLPPKIQDYFDAGVKLVWVIDPELRLVQIYRPDMSSESRLENDLLDGETVLPGFQCPVKDLFPESNTNPKP